MLHENANQSVESRRVIVHTRQVSARIGDFQAPTGYLARGHQSTSSAYSRCDTFVFYLPLGALVKLEPASTPDTDGATRRIRHKLRIVSSGVN